MRNMCPSEEQILGVVGSTYGIGGRVVEQGNYGGQTRSRTTNVRCPSEHQNSYKVSYTRRKELMRLWTPTIHVVTELPLETTILGFEGVVSRYPHPSFP